MDRGNSKRQQHEERPVIRATLAVLLAAFSLNAWSQAYPSRTVRIIVPFGVGGSADVYGRFLAAKLTESTGQSFVVENRPGGGAVIGSDAVAKSPPDGYTLLVMSNTHTVNETLIPKKPYVLMKDLAPVNGINYQDLMLVIHPSVQANTLREFVAMAKAHPGKLFYASSGPGTPYHMAGELFKHMAGVDIVHVPHKGSDQARTAVLGAQVHMMFDAISTIVPHTRGGKLRDLGTTGRTRSTVTPQSPTVSEGGADVGLRGYEATIWLGLMAPAGTPRPVLEKLNAETAKILASSEVKENWGKQGAVPMSMSVDQFDRFLREDVQKWSKLVKDTGMKVD
jgi:tripartite-type tricarboxylate transporter receptor subunit TctC